MVRHRAAPAALRRRRQRRPRDRGHDPSDARTAKGQGGRLREDLPLEVIEAGFTDTSDSTSLWVPDLRLIVAGDVAYNDTHQYTAETTTETREHWAQAAEQLAALRPAAVIAGHKKPDAVDDPAILEQTANYLRDFNKAVAETATAEELYDRMLALYPHRANPGALWGGSKPAKPAHS
ncbi:MBL fold metallo-hydrolase [Streptomyces sp. NPDC048665]|uniref:MBL fold metallo-hydrolase n=1 Tax=Streptomyces sp. NPDC048665 TaxID=3155490 RepID=UPI003426905D